MWKCFSSFDHFPVSKLPCTMPPAICWGICLNDHMGFLLLNFFPHCKVSSFPSTNGVPALLNSPVSHDLSFCRANIFSCWRYRNWIPAGKMAWTVDDNRPINFGRFKTEIFGCLKTFWHCWDICFHFFSERAKVIFSVSITKPKKLYLFHRVQDWFFEVDQKTQML